MPDLVEQLRRGPITIGLANDAADRVEALRAENDRLRAAMAQSDGVCVYCSLPADEWSKCSSGFPGCARADDAMGCPELGARMHVAEQRERIEALEAEIARLKEERDTISTDGFDERQDLRAENARLRELLRPITDTLQPTWDDIMREQQERRVGIQPAHPVKARPDE